MTKRNHFIDSLKGIAALCVILTHYRFGEFRRSILLFPYWVHLAVPLFMIIMAYLTAQSYERSSFTLKDAYSLNNIWRKFKRFTVPFLTAYVIELIMMVFIGKKFSLIEAVFMIPFGGIEENGTYYYPMLLQFIVLAPIMYKAIRENRGAIAVFFILNLLYEILKTELGMSGEVYRILIFRFLFVLAAGMHYAVYGNMRSEGENRLLRTMLVIGAVYIFAANYLGLNIKYFSWWMKTSLPTALFVVPSFIFLSEKFNNLRLTPLESLGRASYSMFFGQMIYYNVYEEPLHLVITEFLPHLFAGIVFSLLLGYMLYLLDEQILSTKFKIPTIAFNAKKKTPLM